MIPRLKPALGWRELTAAVKPFASGDVERFEQRFAQLADQRFAVAFPYGRTALVAILRALGLHDAEIICPSYTCVVVPHAIVTSGNVPVFIDPSEDSFNMNLETVEAAVSERTRVIVATSIFGQPVDLDALDKLTARYPGIHVIQDCAHSFFCEWRGQPVHKSGLCAFYGLNISKLMTSIFGGMVTTDNAGFAARLRRERGLLLSAATRTKSLRRLAYLMAIYPAFLRIGYGCVNWIERCGLIDRFVKYYEEGRIDMPTDYLEQMSALEARVGRVQCNRYDAIVAHRRRLADLYYQGLADIDGIYPMEQVGGATVSHFVARTSAAAGLCEYARAHGFQLGCLIDYYIPEMPAYRDFSSFGGSSGKTLPQEVINLPVHTDVSERDASRLVDLLKQFL